MAFDWIDEHLCAKPGVTKEYQQEWQAMKYLLGGKMFAMLGGDKNEKPIITLKLPPADGLVLREQYPGVVVPGYYMNKQHWNSLYLEADVPRDTVFGMLDAAWACGLAALPKKKQAEIAAL